MVAFGEVGCVASRVGIQAGRELEIAVLLVEVRGDGFAPRDLFVDIGQCRQSGGRAVGLADCNRTIEPDDRSVGEALHPVGSAGNSSPHAESARMSASCTASSAVAKSAPRQTRTLNTRGTSWRSSTSSTVSG